MNYYVCRFCFLSMIVDSTQQMVFILQLLVVLLVVLLLPNPQFLALVQLVGHPFVLPVALQVMLQLVFLLQVIEPPVLRDFLDVLCLSNEDRDNKDIEKTIRF